MSHESCGAFSISFDCVNIARSPKRQTSHWCFDQMRNRNKSALTRSPMKRFICNIRAIREQRCRFHSPLSNGHRPTRLRLKWHTLWACSFDMESIRTIKSIGPVQIHENQLNERNLHILWVGCLPICKIAYEYFVCFFFFVMFSEFGVCVRLYRSMYVLTTSRWKFERNGCHRCLFSALTATVTNRSVCGVCCRHCYCLTQTHWAAATNCHLQILHRSMHISISCIAVAAYLIGKFMACAQFFIWIIIHTNARVLHFDEVNKHGRSVL